MRYGRDRLADRALRRRPQRASAARTPRRRRTPARAVARAGVAIRYGCRARGGGARSAASGTDGARRVLARSTAARAEVAAVDASRARRVRSSRTLGAVRGRTVAALVLVAALATAWLVTSRIGPSPACCRDRRVDARVERRRHHGARRASPRRVVAARPYRPATAPTGPGGGLGGLLAPGATCVAGRSATEARCSVARSRRRLPARSTRPGCGPPTSRRSCRG